MSLRVDGLVDRQGAPRELVYAGAAAPCTARRNAASAMCRLVLHPWQDMTIDI